MEQTPLQNGSRQTGIFARFRRFRRARRGSVAMEFALVSIPFFALLFAIIETALIFFVGQILDSSVSSAARLIRTGQAKQSALTVDGFKTEVCKGMGALASCSSNLYVDVRPYNTFADIVTWSPVDADGNMVTMNYTQTTTGQIVVVSAYYAWPAFFNFFGQAGTTTADGRRLITATVTFKNEPFPW